MRRVLILSVLLLVSLPTRAQEPAPSAALQQAVSAQQLQELQQQIAELQRRTPSPQAIAAIRAQLVLIRAAADKRLCDAVGGRLEAQIQNGQVVTTQCWVWVK